MKNKMTDNLKDELKRWVPIVLISPFILIFVVAIIIKLCILISPRAIPTVLLFDLTIGMSIYDYLSLFANFAGVGVTLFLGVVIYNLNEEKEKININNKVETTKKVIENYLRIILNSFKQKIDFHIQHKYPLANSDNKVAAFDKDWEENLYLISESLGEYFGYLYDLFDYLSKDSILTYSIDKCFIPPLKYLSRSDLELISSIEDLINIDLYASLCLLRNRPRGERVCKYKNGNVFYKEIFTSQGIKYTVYGSSGTKIIDAIFNDCLEYTGFMTLYNNSGSIIVKGEFQDSKLVEGCLFNAICNLDGTFSRQSKMIGFEIIAPEDLGPMAFNVSPIADFSLKDGEYERISDINYARFYI